MSTTDNIFALESFKREFSKVLVESVAGQFGDRLIRSNQIPLESINLRFLLTCASGLAASETGQHQDAALRIAHFILERASAEETGLRSAASVILDKLDNHQAIKLAKQRSLMDENTTQNIPLFLKFESMRREISNSIELNTGNLIVLNRFQNIVFKRALNTDQISISAPTSAGKSFVLYKLMQSLLLGEGFNNAVYLVPTRALINQVQEEIEDDLLANGIDSIFVTSIPEFPISDLRKKLFIYTQERLAWLLRDNPQLIIDVLFVDEAHKIGDGERGMILQNSIETVLGRKAGCKILFASPSIENPELFLENSSNDNSSSIQSEFTAVNQNLLWISQVSRKPQEYQVSLITNGGVTLLGNIRLLKKPTKETEKIPLVIIALSSISGGNLVYASYPSQAEKLAEELYRNLPKVDALSEGIRDLIALAKGMVHKDYLLAKVLEKQIAFHYGDMPMPIREEIERLFKAGELRYLVCTSTLIEGVNLPATNIFLHSPKKGRINPINSGDFWNLAGRAGRMGKEFQGNVVCIKPEEWKEEPPKVKIKTSVERAIRKVTSNAEELLQFIDEGTPRTIASARGDLEYSFSYLYQRYLLNSGYDSTQFVGADSEALIRTLNEKFAVIKLGTTLPDSIIVKNLGISAIAQNNLYRHFQERESWPIPSDPTERYAAQNAYEPLIEIIRTYISGPMDHIPAISHAIFITNWMSGYKLSYLISEQYKHWKKDWSLSKTIRNTLSEIEDFVQFRFLKYVSCYIEILQFHLTAINKQELLARIPKNIGLMLEFGVATDTQISLIKLGFSRYVSLTLTDIVEDQTLSEEELVNIIATDWESWEITKRAKNEIKRVLKIRRL